MLFDRVLGYANHLGFFSEDLDSGTKEQLVTSLYSHLALVNMAVLFAEEEPGLAFFRP